MIFDKPIAFEIGFLTIRWYSLAYLLGVFFVAFYAFYLDKRSKENIIRGKIIFNDLVFCLLMGIVLGGRVGYIVFYNFSFYINHPLEIFKIWTGGMSFHGGLIGGLISTKILSSKANVRFFRMSDLLCVGVPFGLMLGRLSNFANSELYGRKTNFFMGIVFSNVDEFFRHPTQLYEAFFEGFILLCMNFYLYHKYKHKEGLVSGNLVAFYGIFRFILEFFREPDAHLGFFWGFMTMGQILCLPMIAAGFTITLNSIKLNED